ncbi:terminase large subunit [Pseudacidovorax sp. RU35E]|uniref:terminase large subunit n=1 Tax=Pseudacidovorax sp. RU35E TaxID=1907403 RepID=UPI000957395F|nr:terminase TerL endonuclease subunit [Pseudacidovorax sp. RU35E]SIR00147.1 Phage terminase-like protein, large subunit, contains N-terminal HTH domain [Pseudacidovorax sp. RU35E]
MLRGEIVTGRLVYLAVRRHYEDLVAGPKRGLVFSPPHALHVIQFIERFFVHIKGPLAGQAILLDPWQQFWTAVLYGWRYKDTGLRRFSKGYEEVARKNGKSTWKGPQGAYLFMMDGEVGAEVYAMATTRGQAMTVFKPAFDNMKRWVRRSGGMARSLRIYNGLNQEKAELDGSVFEPLPANAENQDGKNPSAVLYDELHAAPSREVWDVMESAFGARAQPLLSAITTAGFILDGICTEVRGYLISVLEGKRQDDSFFGYIYTLDPGDDPFDERVWPKANPGLGSAKRMEYMRGMARKAAALPGAKVNFLTKDLNVWCNSADGWFEPDVWDKGAASFVPAMLRKRRCFGGLDLASTRDLTAFVLIFPPDEEDGEWHVLVWTWCPQAKVDVQEHDDVAAYKRWAEEGWLTPTPGDVTDYAPVKEAILQAVQDFDVESIGFDPWNAQQLCNALMDAGVPLVEIPQNTGGMYPGSKLLEALVYSRRLRHSGNPVLRYCAMNVALLFDTNGNYRPDKKKSQQRGRIDCVVALVMALSRFVKTDGEPDVSGFFSNPVVLNR